MERTQIKNLPAEMMMKIFRLMSPQVLKMVVLVCKLWREMGEHPSLWTWCKVTLTSGGDLEMLDIRRLQQIESIEIESDTETSEVEELFQTVATLPRLKNVELYDTNLSSVEPGLLARVVNRLEMIIMLDTDMTSQQADAVFAAIAEDSTVKILSIGCNNLSNVEPSVIAKAVNRVQKVYMRSIQLSSHQVTAILRQCVEGGSVLEELDFGYNDMTMTGVELGLIREASKKIILRY